MYYPNGRTVMIPVSFDLLWKVIQDEVHNRGQINMVDGNIIAPPRVRHSAVATPILEFIKANPGRYCTREVIQQHPNMNPGSIKSVLSPTRYKALAKNEHGKWYLTQEVAL